MTTEEYTDNEKQLIKYFNIRYIDTTNQPKYVAIARDFLQLKVVINDMLSLPKITLTYTEMSNIFKNCSYFAKHYRQRKSIDNRIYTSILYNIKLNPTKKTKEEQYDELKLDNDELKLKYDELKVKYEQLLNSDVYEVLKTELAIEKSLKNEYRELYNDSHEKLKKIIDYNKGVRKLDNQNKYLKLQLKNNITMTPPTAISKKSQEQLDEELDIKQEEAREEQDRKDAVRQAATNIIESEKTRKAEEASIKAFEKIQLKNKVNREKEAEKSNKTKSNKSSPEDKAEAYRLQQQELTRLREEMDNLVCSDDED